MVTVHILILMAQKTYHNGKRIEEKIYKTTVHDMGYTHPHTKHLSERVLILTNKIN
jgi:hypothetical protein